MDDYYEVLSDTGRFLTILADESHPVDRHCECGRVLMDPWTLDCEVCEKAKAYGGLVRRGQVWMTEETAAYLDSAA